MNNVSHNSNSCAGVQAAAPAVDPGVDLPRRHQGRASVVDHPAASVDHAVDLGPRPPAPVAVSGETWPVSGET